VNSRNQFIQEINEAVDMTDNEKRYAILNAPIFRGTRVKDFTVDYTRIDFLFFKICEDIKDCAPQFNKWRNDVDIWKVIKSII